VRDVSCEGLLVEDIRITLVKDIEELTSSDLVAWRHFLQEINDPRALFQIPELYFQSVANEERVKSLFSCLVFKSNELVGLYTFKIQHVPKKLKFGHFNIWSFYCNEIRSVGAGTLVDCTKPEESFVELKIITLLQQQAKTHNAYVFLEAIEKNDLLYNPQFKKHDSTYYELDGSQTFHLTFKPNFDAYLQSKNKKNRHSIKKDLRRFEKAFDNEFSIKDSYSGLSANEFIESSSTVLLKSWKKGLVGSIVGSEGFLQHLSVLIELDIARIFILEVENKPVAFAIGYSFGNNFFYEEIAYDEVFAKSGVGSYLTISVVKSLHNEMERSEDVRSVFSFGVGDNIYKRKLCDEYIDCKNLMLCSPRSKMSAFFQAKQFLDKSYKLLRNTIISLGLHTKLRQKFKQR